MHDAKNCLVERYVPHGMDIFEMFADLSYAEVLAVLVAVNTAPILMPPTWIILSSFYAADPSFNPVYLATGYRTFYTTKNQRTISEIQGEQKSRTAIRLPSRAKSRSARANSAKSKSFHKRITYIQYFSF